MTLDRSARVGPTLFLCLFAAQAALIALSPVLAEVAADFEVSTATAGQLRSVSGVAAGVTALAMGAVAGRLGLRDLLLVGLRVLALGSLASAAAPSFAALVVAQVAVGAGLAAVLSGGLAAAAAWTSEDRQAGVLSWALIGQPGAWIVGLPMIGLVGDASWRLGWLAVPFAACVLALLAVGARSPDAATEPARGTWRLLRRSPEVAWWGLGELPPGPGRSSSRARSSWSRMRFRRVVPDCCSAPQPWRICRATSSLAAWSRRRRGRCWRGCPW